MYDIIFVYPMHTGQTLPYFLGLNFENFTLLFDLDRNMFTSFRRKSTFYSSLALVTAVNDRCLASTAVGIFRVYLVNLVSVNGSI